MMIITFQCQECGVIVKALVQFKMNPISNKWNSNISFSIMDKLYSKEQCLTDLGYFLCIDCHKRSTHIKFDKVYS